MAAVAVFASTGVCSHGTATHFSLSFLSVSPSEAVVSSVSASAPPVLVLLLAVARLVVELLGILAPITTGTARGLSLASWRERDR